MSDFAVTTTLTAKDAGMSAAMEKVGGAAHKAEKFLDQFKDKFKEAFSFGAGAGLGAMAGEKLAEGIQEAARALPEFAEKMETLTNDARKTGLSVETYQRLGYAMKMAGVPAEMLDTAFKKLNVGLAQMHVHQGPLIEGLKRLNPALLIQLRDAKNNEEAFLDVSDAIQKEGDATKRAAMAQVVFGKTGTQMLPMLLRGKDGLKDLMVEADKYGNIIGDKAVEAGEKMFDSIKRLNGSFDAMKDHLLGDLAEGLAPLMNSFAEFVAQNRGLVTVIENIGIAALSLVAIFAVVKGSFMFFTTVAGVLKVAGLAWEAYRLYAVGAATAQEALNLVMAANPLGLMVTAVALLIAGIAALVIYWDQLTGKLNRDKVSGPVKGGGKNAAADALVGTNVPRQSRAQEAAAYAKAHAVKYPNSAAMGVQVQNQNIVKVDVTGVPGAQVKTTQSATTNTAPAFSPQPSGGQLSKPSMGRGGR